MKKIRFEELQLKSFLKCLCYNTDIFTLLKKSEIEFIFYFKNEIRTSWTGFKLFKFD